MAELFLNILLLTRPRWEPKSFKESITLLVSLSAAYTQDCLQSHAQEIILE